MIGKVNVQVREKKSNVKNIKDVVNVEFFDQNGIIFPKNDYRIVDKATGSSIVSNNDGVACAKVEHYGQNTDDILYYVKRGSVGHHHGRMLNPYSSMASPRDFVAYDTHSGRPYFDYVRVSEEIFIYYVSYLRTRNPSYLHNAERNYNNG